MSDEEYRKLKLGDYVYRESDGWGGILQSAPGYAYDKHPEERPINDEMYLTIENGYAIFDGRNNFKAKDRKLWRVMDEVNCTNALALSRYALYRSYHLQEALMNTTIL